MKAILEKYRAKVSCFNDPRDGLESFKKEDVDLVFMDKNMPFIQGNEAIKLIRKFEKDNNKTPAKIIALTGDSDENTQKEFYEAGANSILTKPVHIDQLKNTLLKILNNR